MTGAPPPREQREPGPALVRTRSERGSRGPVPRYSREALVAAAVALADEAGLAAVSMRAVAAASGTGAGSLYRYLASRDDLVDLMADRVVAELRPYPVAGDRGEWLDAMLELGRRQLALYRRHPWLLDVGQRVTLGPESLAWFDCCLGVLEPVACPVRAKFEAIAMMTGITTLVARSGAGPASSPFSGIDVAAHPHLAAAIGRPPGPPPPQDLYERTLRALLTGLLVVDPDG